MWLKNIFLLSLLCLFPSLLTAQNQPPVVSNVRFSQRPECFPQKVDVYYDVYDPENCAMDIYMEASSDNGNTWGLNCSFFSGDVGKNIFRGTNKQIVWDFGNEHPNFYSNNVKIKITAVEFNCGIATVSYSGKAYSTVQIGFQCWLKENLDVGTMIQGSDVPGNNGAIEKYCYNNDPANCSIYGGLYQWNEAMSYVTSAPARGICPPGWHIPTTDELQTLSSTVGGNSNALKAVGQGSGSGAGTNSSGFSALLAGYCNSSSFNSLTNSAFFWSSTQYNGSISYTMNINYSVSNIYFSTYYKVMGNSIRCLRD